jgi:uncharacterized protein (TIGR02444 family)
LTAWTFATAFWRRPETPPLCLELQEVFGQSIPLLLWRLWAVRASRGVSPKSLAEAVALARAWDERAIRPLRAIRASLKTPPPPLDAEASRRVRDQIFTAELSAERTLIEALERLTGPAVTVRDDALPALIETCAAWGAPAPTDRLIQLVQAL